MSIAGTVLAPAAGGAAVTTLFTTGGLLLDREASNNARADRTAGNVAMGMVIAFAGAGMYGAHAHGKNLVTNGVKSFAVMGGATAGVAGSLNAYSAATDIPVWQLMGDPDKTGVSGFKDFVGRSADAINPFD